MKLDDLRANRREISVFYELNRQQLDARRDLKMGFADMDIYLGAALYFWAQHIRNEGASLTKEGEDWLTRIGQPLPKNGSEELIPAGYMQIAFKKADGLAEILLRSLAIP